MKPNDFHFKQDLDSITKLTCQKRYDQVVGLINKINNKPDAQAELNKWNMNFSTDVIKFETKVLLQNKILFSNTLIDKAQPKGWDIEVQKARHISSVSLNNWIVFYLPREHDSVGLLINEIIDISRNMGFIVSNPKRIRLEDSRGNSAQLFAQSVKKELGEAKDQKVQMIFCITPNKAKDTYDVIKRLCCLTYGVPCQIVTSNTLNSKNVKSILTKVAIQICCKLGGEIWGLHIPVNIFNFHYLKYSDTTLYRIFVY